MTPPTPTTPPRAVPVDPPRPREAAEARAGMAAWESRVAGWGGHIFRDRPTPRPGDVVLLSNDYLALARHPDVVDAQVRALTADGAGTTISGIHVPDDGARRRLEADLAEFLCAPAAVLCQSGWDANVGLLSTVLDDLPPGTPVYLDQLAHASLRAGAAAGRGVLRSFAHNRTGHLERLVARHGPGIVGVDSVYSVTGDQAPLAELAELCERYGCVLVADESHALGVHGPAGNGLVAELGLTGRVAYRTASLAKSFCGRAGMVAAGGRFCDYLPFRSPNAIFSSSLLPHDIAGLHAALRVIRTDDVRRKQLWHNTERLHAGLRAHGCDLGASTGPILPLHTGSEANLRVVQCGLDELGVFGAAFIPPATPYDHTVLRLTVHTGLSEEDIDRVVRSCATVAELIVPRPASRDADLPQ